MFNRSNPLSQIPVRNNPSTLGEAAFSAYLAGMRPENTSIPAEKRPARMTADEYFVVNANMTADHVTDHRPRFFLPLAPTLVAYVKARLDNTRERDHELATRLGHWIAGVIRAAEENGHNLKHLLWARGWLEKAKLARQVEKIDRMIEEFSRVEVPSDHYACALQVQEKDALSRIMGGR